MSQHWQAMVRRIDAFRSRVGYDLLSPYCDVPLRGNDTGVGENSRRYRPLSLPLPMGRPYIAVYAEMEGESHD